MNARDLLSAMAATALGLAGCASAPPEPAATPAQPTEHTGGDEPAAEPTSTDSLTEMPGGTTQQGPADGDSPDVGRQPDEASCAAGSCGDPE